MIFKSKSDDTRSKILEIATITILKNGYSKTSMNQLVTASGLSKGAFYHYFSSKQDLGLAVINEVIKDEIYDRWIAPLEGSSNLLETIVNNAYQRVGEIIEAELQCLGCPITNMSNEMSNVDEEMRQALKSAGETSLDKFAEVIKYGQDTKQIRTDLDPLDIARFIIACFKGMTAFVKTSRNDEYYASILEQLKIYLQAIKYSAK